MVIALLVVGSTWIAYFVWRHGWETVWVFYVFARLFDLLFFGGALFGP